MPDNLEVEINGVSNSSPDKLNDAMWHLDLQSPTDKDGASGKTTTQYPDRPGEPDCIYYLRTGVCGYGSNCRFNHPAYIGQLAQYNNELPERHGQPDCQFFLKTGACKFGTTCKYHHPRDKPIAMQVPLNVYGLPMRQDEKPCPFYMRTWSCKFGVACKFHHPQPAGVSTALSGSGSPTYGSAGSSAVPSSGLSYVGGLPTWPLPRSPSVPGLPMQSPQAYMPLIFSPSHGMIPGQQRWNTYLGTVNPLPSMTSNALGYSNVYNSRYQTESVSTGQAGLSELVPHYPERPEQPECQYFMKTGRCKFGSDCKYHHPKERLASSDAYDLGPYGLPLRPGQAVCSNYTMYGMCKFGSTCKFDHPWTGYYNYGVSMPMLSIVDPTLIPNHIISPASRASKTPPSKSSKLSDQTKFEEVQAEHEVPRTKSLDDAPQEATSFPHTTPTSEHT